jgi:hypothetical protein
MTLVSAQLKLDVTIPAEGGIELGAWLFLPEGDGIRPAPLCSSSRVLRRAHERQITICRHQQRFG